MKVQSIINRFRPKLVNIHSDGMPKRAAEQLESASGMLENYAKHNKVEIDVYGGQRLLGEDFAETFPSVTNELGKKLQIVVRNLKTKKHKFGLVAADTEASTVNTKLKPFIIEDLSDGTQYVRNVKQTYEDSFLRNVYRNIERLTKNVKK